MAVIQKIDGVRFIPGGPGAAHKELEDIPFWRSIAHGEVIEVSEDLAAFLLAKGLVKIVTKAEKVAATKVKTEEKITK